MAEAAMVTGPAREADGVSFDALFEAMELGVVYQDRDDRILAANPAAERVLGLTREQLLGLSSFDPRWRTIREDGTDFSGADHPSVVAMRTGVPVRGVLMGVFHPGLEAWRWIVIDSFPEFRDGDPLPFRTFTLFRDITEQRAAEAALRERERRFSQLIRNSFDTVVILDADGIQRYVSPSGERVHGYAPAELVDIPVIDRMIHPEDRERVLAAFRQILETGSGGVRYRHRRKAGGWVHLEARGTNQLDNPDIGGVVVNVRDITEQELAEEARREQQQTTQAIVDSSRDWIWGIDLEGRHVYSNGAIRSILGFSPDEFVGTGLELLHPEDRQRVEAQWPVWVAAREGWRNLVLRWRTKEGSYRFLESSAVPFLTPSGELAGFRGVDRDITEQRAAEDALRESEARYRALFDTMHEGFAFHEVICDDAGEVVDYRYLDINPAFERLTGLKRETTVGRTVRELLPDIEADWIRVFGKVAMTGEPAERESYVRELDRYYRAHAYSPRRGTFAVVFEETTAQRHAQRELERRERLYNDLIETATDLVWRCDAEGRYTFLNKAWEKVFGYALDEMLGRSFTDFMDPEQAERDLAMFARLLAENGRVEGYETIHRCKDGTPVHLVFNATHYHDESGRTVGTQGTAHDVTERRRGEAALRQSEERFKALSDAVFGGVIIHDQGVILECNRGLSDVTGFSHDELVGMQGFDLIAPESLPTVLANVRNRYDKAYEVVGLRKDGSRYPLAIRGKNVVYQGRDVRVIEFMDVTEQKQAEEALRASEERFRSIMELSPDIFSIIGPEGQLLYNSPAALRVHGYAEEDLAGRNTFTLIHPDDRDAVGRTFALLLANPGQIHSVRYRYLNKDGSYSWMECAASNQLANPRVQGVIAVSRNIDESVRMEKERIDLERQLLHAQKLESLGVLAGGIAHDFNNILMAILGNADLARRRIDRGSPAYENMQAVSQAATRAADLARQMLAYSGKGRFVVEPVDLNDLLEDMLHMLEVSISKKAVIRMAPHRPLPAVEADVTQIRQVVMNLVINASEAIGDVDGVISVSTRVVECDRAYLKAVWPEKELAEGPYVALEVSDTGCGMDKETLARLFDPFFSTKFTGRGLGMSAVLGIVRGHDGAITVVSAPGRGTTFTVLLPASERVAEQPVETGVPGEWTGRGKVLLVDDEASVRAVGARMLGELGFTPVTAVDGVEALEVFRGDPGGFAAVILDLTMPRLGGEPCFREIRRISPEAKVLIVSGYGEQEVEPLVAEGLAGFIPKPYALETLRDAMRKAVP
jgi:PAS domain S-box-containing protein